MSYKSEKLPLNSRTQECSGKTLKKDTCFFLQLFFRTNERCLMPIRGTISNQTIPRADCEVTFSTIQHGGQWTTLQQPLHGDFYRLAYPIGSWVFRERRGDSVIVVLFNTERHGRTTHQWQPFKTCLSSSFLFIFPKPSISLMTSGRCSKWIGYLFLRCYYIVWVT